MKWVAVLLIILNLGAWYLSRDGVGVKVTPSAGSGSLPRVASLKTNASVSPRDVQPEEQSYSTAVSKASNELECVSLGWLSSREVAEVLAASIESDVGIRVEEVERVLPSLHWIIIPPQPESIAQKQFRNIQRQGIDSYLVTEGENRNAISLGLFESREAAISVLEEKKRQNLNVVLANFPRNQISYALVFEAEPKLVKSTVQAVETGYGKNFDFIEINPCKSVATP